MFWVSVFLEIAEAGGTPYFVTAERSKSCLFASIRHVYEADEPHTAHPSGRLKNESWKINGGREDNVPAEHRIVTGLPNSGNLFCEECGRLSGRGQASAAVAAARHTARLRSLCVL